MSLTIDASVFVASIRTQEPHRLESIEFFRQIIVRDIGVICPTIVLTETVAASARRGADAALIITAHQAVLGLPKIEFITIDINFAEFAAQVAETYRLRAADAIYLAVAIQENTTLITWDDEMQKRGVTAATVLTPTQWLAQLPATL